MEKIKQMEEQLSSIIQTQLCNPEQVDAKELGEVVDMLKDLAEFCYYKTVTEAMEESKDDKQQPKTEKYYYTQYLPYEKSYKYNPYRDMDIDDGRMYYGGERSSNYGGGQNSNTGGGPGVNARMYTEDSYPMMIRDYREGRSPIMRRNYMESKELHQDPAKQMRDLEKYMKELSTDITEMIEDATPEEKQVLKQKMNQLVDLIG